MQTAPPCVHTLTHLTKGANVPCARALPNTQSNSPSCSEGDYFTVGLFELGFKQDPHIAFGRCVSRVSFNLKCHKTSHTLTVGGTAILSPRLNLCVPPPPAEPLTQTASSPGTSLDATAAY